MYVTIRQKTVNGGLASYLRMDMRLGVGHFRPNDSMKVYVIGYPSHYGFDELIGVFTTREKALLFVKDIQSTINWNECICELELDTEKPYEN